MIFWKIFLQDSEKLLNVLEITYVTEFTFKIFTDAGPAIFQK